MQVNEAVKAAKAYISELYKDEKIVEIGLEEVEFDDSERVWSITIGFRRPWSRKEERSEAAKTFQPANYHDRWYKLVQIKDSDGRVVAVKDRELKAA